jgi:hypothetical protein
MAELIAQAAPKAQPATAGRLLQRACSCGGNADGECESCKKKRLQRKGNGARPDVRPSAIGPFERGGQPLARPWRERLEPLFGVDFADVRLHDDSASHTSARDLDAHAFTVGQHIHFASGQFRPDAREGLHLLAHELTHTVQQRGAVASVATDAVDVDAADSALERAAETTADAVAAGRPAHVRSGLAGASVQRLVQRKGESAGTRSRTVDANTTVQVTRSLIERPCVSVPATKQLTPTDRILVWDQNANAIKFQYVVCRGKVQLSSDASIDYSDVVRAAKDLILKVGNNPGTGNTAALEDAVNSARISASGHITFTVSRTLDVTVSGESSSGAQQQKAQAKIRLLIDTANSKVQVIAEAGAGITQTDLTKEVEKFVRGQLNLGPVKIEVKFVDRTTTPAGGLGSSQSETSIRIQGPKIPKIPVATDCTFTKGSAPGDDKVICSVGTPLDTPSKPKEVSCYACDCPPPRPDYTCRRIVKPHPEKVVDVEPGKKTERMLYAYDSDAPANEDEFTSQASSIASLVGTGYHVKHILGYASPEASRAYNEKLGQRRADKAHKRIQAELTKQSIQTPLPAPKGVGELLGESSVREGKEAYDRELVKELSDKLRDLDENGRLDLLGVDGPRRSDPVQRKQVLADIQAFIDGKDAEGKTLGQRARWEKVFPHLRRVEVLVEREEVSHLEMKGGSDGPSACDDADKAFIDAELGPISPEQRLPQGGVC